MKTFAFLIMIMIISVCTTALTDSNDKSTNILGNFEVQFLQGEKPINTITFGIEENNLSFKGCNLVDGPYTYDPATLQWQFNSYSSTKIYCIIDQDFQVIEALRNAGIAYRRGNFVLFQDKSGAVTLKLKQVQRCPGNSDIIGYYQVIKADGITLTASITLTIDEKNVGFRGCNIGGGQYKYNARTCSWSVGAIIQTLRACTPDDQDGLVVSSLQNANFVYRIGQFIIFDGIGQKQLMKAKYISASPNTP